MGYDKSDYVERTLMDLNRIPKSTHLEAPPDYAGTVILIKFQSGPIKEAGVNGCQVEDVIDVLIARLEGFEKGPLPCKENREAIRWLDEAKWWLLERTRDRVAQGVEGTMGPHETAMRHRSSNG